MLNLNSIFEFKSTMPSVNVEGNRSDQMTSNFSNSSENLSEGKFSEGIAAFKCHVYPETIGYFKDELKDIDANLDEINRNVNYVKVEFYVNCLVNELTVKKISIINELLSTSIECRDFKSADLKLQNSTVKLIDANLKKYIMDLEKEDVDSPVHFYSEKFDHSGKQRFVSAFPGLDLSRSLNKIDKDQLILKFYKRLKDEIQKIETSVEHTDDLNLIKLAEICREKQLRNKADKMDEYCKTQGLKIRTLALRQRKIEHILNEIIKGTTPAACDIWSPNCDLLYVPNIITTAECLDELFLNFVIAKNCLKIIEFVSPVNKTDEINALKIVYKLVNRLVSKPDSMMFTDFELLSNETLASFLHKKIHKLQFVNCGGVNGKTIDLINQISPSLQFLSLNCCSDLDEIIPKAESYLDFLTNDKSAKLFLSDKFFEFPSLRELYIWKCENLKFIKINAISLNSMFIDLDIQKFDRSLFLKESFGNLHFDCWKENGIFDASVMYNNGVNPLLDHKYSFSTIKGKVHRLADSYYNFEYIGKIRYKNNCGIAKGDIV